MLPLSHLPFSILEVMWCHMSKPVPCQLSTVIAESQLLPHTPFITAGSLQGHTHTSALPVSSTHVYHSHDLFTLIMPLKNAEGLGSWFIWFLTHLILETHAISGLVKEQINLALIELSVPNVICVCVLFYRSMVGWGAWRVWCMRPQCWILMRCVSCPHNTHNPLNSNTHRIIEVLTLSTINLCV